MKCALNQLIVFTLSGRADPDWVKFVKTCYCAFSR